MNQYNQMNFIEKNFPIMSDFSDEEEKSFYTLDKTVIYGEDYPSRQIDHEMYIMLQNVLSGSYVGDILTVERLKNFLNNPLTVNFLFENNFIKQTDPHQDIDVKEELSKMDAHELSQLLHKYGIKLSGKKKKLIKKASQIVPKYEFASGNVTITPEGNNFLNDNKWINLYENCLTSFYFDEFNRYLSEHEGDYYSIALEYIQKHLAYAEKHEDFRYYDLCNGALADFYSYKEDYKKALIFELKRFILRLNPPFYTYAKLYSLYYIFIDDSISAIEFFCDDLKIDNLEEIFLDTYDSMNLEKKYVSGEVAFKYLKRALDEENLEKLSVEFDEKYFNSGEEFLNIAKGYYEDGNYSEAFDFASLSLEVSPNQSETIYYMALILAKMEEFDSALDAINDAIEIDSTDARFFSFKALCQYIRLENMDEVVRNMEHALKLSSDDITVLLDAAEFFKLTNDFTNSLKCLNKAIELDKTNPKPYESKIKVAILAENDDEIEKTFKELYEIVGDDREYFFNRAMYFNIKLNFEKTMEYLDKILEIDINDALIWIFKAIVYSDMDEDEMFKKCISKVENINPHLLFAFYDLLSTSAEG